MQFRVALGDVANLIAGLEGLTDRMLIEGSQFRLPTTLFGEPRAQSDGRRSVEG